tara:strand:- start:480 stop:929 length:450 start_codon:yes stop_codon:yes gene_type:complete
VIKNKIENIKDTLESLKIGNMGLHYLVDLGKVSKDKFPVEDKTEENFIHGCTSYAWIKLESHDPIQIRTVSDSMIVGGILALLEQAFNGEPKSSIEDYDGQDLIDGFGLEGHISSQRLRGFAEAVRMMKGTGEHYSKTRPGFDSGKNNE